MSGRSAFADGTLLAIGTLTRIPVAPPSRIDRRVAGTAMSFAPAVGALIALPLGVATQLLADATRAPWLAAVLAVAAVAWLTRALHLDGLADTADALGSGAEPTRALEIARRSDIGPFGVVVLVLVLLAQVVAIATLADLGVAGVGVVLALVAGRLAATAACVRGIPSARPEGLGATVAGSVPRWVPIAWLAAIVAVVLLAPSPGPDADATRGLAIGVVELRWALLASLAAATVVALASIRTAVRRLGGVTGDTLGSAIETTTAAALVALAVAVSISAA